MYENCFAFSLALYRRFKTFGIPAIVVLSLYRGSFFNIHVRTVYWSETDSCWVSISTQAKKVRFLFLRSLFGLPFSVCLSPASVTFNPMLDYWESSVAKNIVILRSV